MSQYQRLLVMIDPAQRQASSINHAAALARASGASLHIAALIAPVKGLSMFDEGDRQRVRKHYLQNQRDWLETQAQTLRGRGIEVTTEVAWTDDLGQDIIDHVTDMQPDLLIKQIQHESKLKRAFFTAFDWYLLRHCPVPVYLVGGSSFVLPRKVVAAVEVSEIDADNALNDLIIKQARSLAMQCNAELHLLYACDIPAAYLADFGSLTLAELTQSLRRDLEKSFLRLAGRYGVPSELRHLIEGHPVRVLSEYAHEHQVDVIVMGKTQSHGMGKLLGSTTEHILYQVPCCVLAV